MDTAYRAQYSTFYKKNSLKREGNELLYSYHIVKEGKKEMQNYFLEYFIYTNQIRYMLTI